MSNRLALRRRSFLGSVAALSSGFALGWHVPAFAQSGGHELGIWVVISPDAGEVCGGWLCSASARGPTMTGWVD